MQSNKRHAPPNDTRRCEQGDHVRHPWADPRLLLAEFLLRVRQGQGCRSLYGLCVSRCWTGHGLFDADGRYVRTEGEGGTAGSKVVEKAKPNPYGLNR